MALKDSKNLKSDSPLAKNELFLLFLICLRKYKKYMIENALKASEFFSGISICGPFLFFGNRSVTQHQASSTKIYPWYWCIHRSCKRDPDKMGPLGWVTERRCQNESKTDHPMCFLFVWIIISWDFHFIEKYKKHI